MTNLAVCSYDRGYTLPASKFKRTGYSFNGWNTKKNGTGKTVVLYAQWKKVKK